MLGNSTNSETSTAGPGSIAWQWDEAEAGEHRGRVFLDLEGGGCLVLTFINHETAEIQRTGSSGESVWVQSVPSWIANSAALLLHAGKLYAALYSDMAAGCRVLALDAASGDLLWDTPLKGLGPIHHSKYRNRVQLRFIHHWNVPEGGRLVIFGQEAGGKYIEVLEPDSGRQLSHQMVQP